MEGGQYGPEIAKFGQICLFSLFFRFFLIWGVWKGGKSKILSKKMLLVLNMHYWAPFQMITTHLSQNWVFMHFLASFWIFSFFSILHFGPKTNEKLIFDIWFFCDFWLVHFNVTFRLVYLTIAVSSFFHREMSVPCHLNINSPVQPHGMSYKHTDPGYEITLNMLFIIHCYIGQKMFLIMTKTCCNICPKLRNPQRLNFCSLKRG